MWFLANTLPSTALNCPGWEKKARIAIPYALEDKFAENVDELHFAFNRQYYQQGQYLIAACKKEFLQQLLLLLKDNDIHLDILTVDWFALENKEICVAEDSLIIHDETFCGVLNPPLTDLFLKKQARNIDYSFLRKAWPFLSI